MFAAILLSQFNSCPKITIATDDLITTTDDVITTHNLHSFGGKSLVLPVFRTENSPLQIYFLEIHKEILM